MLEDRPRFLFELTCLWDFHHAPHAAVLSLTTTFSLLRTPLNYCILSPLFPTQPSSIRLSAGERRGTTYVSRLQALQAAIAMQVETLAKAKPAQRVGLVTFASDVTIYSDGTGEPRVLAGSRLGDYAALRAAGDGATPAKPVKDTAEALVRRIYGLREEGATALGPAVLVAVAMAAGRPGSRVVIVTDGMANTGLGSLEPPDLPAGASPEMKEQAAQSAKAESDAFYGKVRGLAMEAGVTVDVIGFSDANCNLEALSALAEATGGSVTRVEPATITEQFAGVLEEEVLAINASVTMVSDATAALFYA